MSLKVAVIGGGPGGYVAAIRAAQLGADVTLIEKENLGGACLNVGCIPTKALLHTAELLENAKNGESLGVEAKVSLNFAKAQAHKAQVVKKLVGGVAGLLRANKVEVLKGAASFEDARTLKIVGRGEDQTRRFDKIIVASGSVPVTPPIPGADSRQCMDSTGALDLEAVPASMVVIGGGVIGVELATLYSTLGCKVVIVEMLDGILTMMDAELVGLLRKDLAARGVEIYTGAKVASVADKGREAAVRVEMGDGSVREFMGEKVLVSVGRRPNTEGLGLERAGVACERGRITVNDAMETSVSGIYAIGDCNGRIMLAHVASAQGEVAAENAMGRAARFDALTNASCVYTHPEFAGVGLTEEQAREQGLAYDVAKFPLQANGKALIENGGKGVIKILAGKEHREIIGVHMYGPRATDMIAEAALAVGMEATTDELIATIHAHPTLSEAVREAALAVENRAIHIPNRGAR